MIITEISYGLGNQLFQYAFARALQLKSGGKILINTYPKFRIRPYREYSLNHFKLQENLTVPPMFIQKMLDYRGRIKRRILRALLRDNSLYTDPEKILRYAKHGIYCTQMKSVWYDFPEPGRRIMQSVEGLWFNRKWFENAEEVIRKDLTIVTPPDERNAEWLSRITASPAPVCVHIRRGDFLTDSRFDICTQAYYERAVELLAGELKAAEFYIFSYSHEDVEYIRNHYHFCCRVNYVDLNNPDYEELRLMSSCSHFILSNSTFSWWAQFLSKNPEKKVVSPSRWNADPGLYDADQIIEKDWIILDPEGLPAEGTKVLNPSTDRQAAIE